MSARAMWKSQVLMLSAASAWGRIGSGAPEDLFRRLTFDWRGAPPIPPFAGHSPVAAPDPSSACEGTLMVSESAPHAPKKCEYGRSLVSRLLGARYDVLCHLGQGGTGQVWLLWDTILRCFKV